MYLQAETVEFDLSGASQLDLEGATVSSVIYASGASQASLLDFPVDDGYFNLSGASDATATTWRAWSTQPRTWDAWTTSVPPVRGTGDLLPICRTRETQAR